MKPELHSQAAANKWGGKMKDYLPLDQMMDSSKQAVSSNKHRTVFHHSFGTFIMEQMFGIDYESLEELREKYNLPLEFIKDVIEWKDSCTINGKVRINSAGKKYSVRDHAEYHILSDFRMKFIPTLQDYSEHMEMAPWMENGAGVPNRLKGTIEQKTTINFNGLLRD